MEALRLRAAESLWFIDDIAAVAQISDRFGRDYGQVIAAATTEAARDRAVRALYHYLTARPAPRKPWSLGPAEAERAMAALLELVAGRGGG